MITKLDPRKIAQLLNQGTRQLDASILTGLASARQNALARQSVHARAVAFNTGHQKFGQKFGWTPSLIPHSTQHWIVAGLLVAMFAFSASYWHHAQDLQISELDVAILTDDLPMEVFVD